jgi:deoxyribodipyrimidine photo-lyase
LDSFLATALAGYKAERNIPGIEGTSRLSPHLQWGEISPRTIWARTIQHMLNRSQNPGLAAVESLAALDPNGVHFLSEVAWREFSTYLLYHFPQLPHQPLRQAFQHFPWRTDPTQLDLWQRGLTGYPIVDAGMRELWHTGTMHNRVRMITASFLVKHLLQPWQEGEAWFWDTLVDADLAANSASWQWVAGCGADAAPYFRIFNPVLQGEKFDPEGEYIRTWCPELAKLPARFIHKPFEAPEMILRAAGVTLGQNYPKPVIGLAEGRARALAAFAGLRGG